MRRALLGVAVAATLASTMPAGASTVDKMMGGGSVEDPQLRVTLGMTLPCTATDPGAELEIVQPPARPPGPRVLPPAGDRGGGVRHELPEPERRWHA